MSNLILPGQQQQATLQFQMLKKDNSYMLVILTGGSQFIPLPPGPLEHVEGFANAILGAAAQAREQDALTLRLIQGNGAVVE